MTAMQTISNVLAKVAGLIRKLGFTTLKIVTSHLNYLFDTSPFNSSTSRVMCNELSVRTSRRRQDMRKISHVVWLIDPFHIVCYSMETGIYAYVCPVSFTILQHHGAPALQGCMTIGSRR